MNLHQVALYAEDLERARRFYEEHLDAAFIALFDPPGLLFLQLGNTRLLIERQAPRSLLYFAVDDVDTKVAQLRSVGVTIDTEPHTIFRDDEGLFGAKGAEERMAFIHDSEGNLVGLVSRK